MKTLTNVGRVLRKALLLIAVLAIGAATGSLIANSVSAEPPSECDHGECEHRHRWYWWDSHKCVPNDNNVACGTDKTGDHGCETKECDPA